MNAAKVRAPFIVIDGQDGSGKGTQIRLLQEHLARERVKAVFTREPGGVPLSESLRMVIKSDDGMSSDPFTQFLMFWAARNEWVKQLVLPSLESGIPVFSDRGDSSTYAYQVRAQNALELEDEFWRLRDLVFGDCTPSAYIIIDVPAEVARQRSLADGAHISVFDNAQVEFYERVRQGFRVFENKALVDVFLVDGTQTINEVHENISYLVRDIMYG